MVSLVYESIQVKVIAINDTADCVVFHTIDKDFDIYPDAVGSTGLGQQYRMIGIDGKGRPNVKSGMINKERGKFFVTIKRLINRNFSWICDW